MPPANPTPVPPQLTQEVPPRPDRAETTHKGQAGHVAILAGSRGMSGAAVLAGLGALRGGAGLVKILTAESVQPIVAASEPCLMTVGIAESGIAENTPGRMLRLPHPSTCAELRWAHAVAAGPGMGQRENYKQDLIALLRDLTVPVVLDADALNSLAAPAGGTQTCGGAKTCGETQTSGEAQTWWLARAGRPMILTPHPGEMARLRRSLGLLPAANVTEDEPRLASAAEVAHLTGAIVVLKGHRTVVSTAHEAYLNTTGNPGMAAGGMGDVLTGLITALLAQGMTPWDACRLGVYAHGLAADRLAQTIGPVGYLAREVADALPAALAEASRPRLGFV